MQDGSESRGGAYANRIWAVERWMDEIMPMAETPEGFALLTEGGWRLIDPDEDPADDMVFNEPLEVGQIVTFVRLVNHDTFRLTINADRSWVASDGYEQGAEWYRIVGGDALDCFASIPDLVSAYDGLLSDPPAPGTYEIECWTLQDGHRFRFVPQGDTPVFEACAGAN